jgi:hypothetical protein
MKRGFMTMSARSLILAITIILVIPFQVSGQERRPPTEERAPKMVGPVWIEGKVTAKPWADNYRHIEVDKKTYTLMPDIRIAVRYQTQPGIINERQVDFHQIRQGQHITMKVEGLRVYEIQLDQ